MSNTLLNILLLYYYDKAKLVTLTSLTSYDYVYDLKDESSAKHNYGNCFIIRHAQSTVLCLGFQRLFT